MALQEFRIELDNNLKTYSPGDNVSGRVIAATNTNKTVKGLQISWQGRVEVELGEGDKRNQSQSVLYCSTFLLGDGIEIAVLPAGRNVYPFNFVIPHVISGTVNPLPSSFRGEFGRIWYELKALISPYYLSDGLKETGIYQQFLVNGLVDLNQCAGASQPDEWTKQFSFLGCPSVGVQLKLSKQGFLPLEFIAPHVKVFNHSGSLLSISRASVTLLQIVTYTVKDKTKETTAVLSKIERGEAVESGETDIWPNSKVIQIPLVPPTGGCDLIKIEYVLKVELYVAGIPYWKLKKLIPITIGTIPLARTALLASKNLNPPVPPHAATGPGGDAKNLKLASKQGPSTFTASAPPLPNLGGGGDNIPPPPSYYESVPSSSNALQKAYSTEAISYKLYSTAE